MEKVCEMCGGVLETLDNRRKYCDSCRKTRKHFFDAAAVHKARQAARERRKSDAVTLRRQAEEINSLRQIIARQRAEIEKLKEAVK